MSCCSECASAAERRVEAQGSRCCGTAVKAFCSKVKCACTDEDIDCMTKACQCVDGQCQFNPEMTKILNSAEPVSCCGLLWDDATKAQFIASCNEMAQIEAHAKAQEQEKKSLERKMLVQNGYAEIATITEAGHDKLRTLAQAFGYDSTDLKDEVQAANLGLSCGNPIALASIREGEVVVDLGSGAGFDVFLAARKVGASGKVYGIDFTMEMLEMARATQAQRGITNVEFVQGDIEAIPLPDGCADVVISNCVINLAPNKAKVFSEIARILKPGGRAAISDMLAKKEVPDFIRNTSDLIVGCIGGAILDTEYAGLMEQAGLQVQVVDSGLDMNVYNYKKKRSAGDSGCNCCCSNPGQNPDGPTMDSMGLKIEDVDLNEFVFSGKIFATKPIAAPAACARD